MTTEHMPKEKIERLHYAGDVLQNAKIENIVIDTAVVAHLGTDMKISTGTISKKLVWTEKGWTKDCQCGEKINYLSKICPYCNGGQDDTK